MHLIEANLLDDGGRKHKRQEIFEYFQAHKSLAERTEFLKNSYNDIWVEVLTDGVRTLSLIHIYLFKTDAEREADRQERIQIVPAAEVFPYSRQPYTIDRPTPDLVRLMDSIERCV